jgi:ERCC4-like helicases
MPSLRTRTPIIRLKPVYKNSVIVLCFRFLPSERRAIQRRNRTSRSRVSEFDLRIARHAVVLCGKERFGSKMLFMNRIGILSTVFLRSIFTLKHR